MLTGYVCILFFCCSDDRTLGLPDSSNQFFDLIPFIYLLIKCRVSCWRRDVPLVPYQRDFGFGFFPGVVGGFLYAIA